ncbi:MAG: asparagine synthase (glutamine-hydrolyzing) [Desulfococcaceae bacterium]
MCGIIGIASNRIKHERSVLLTMRDTMIHRGPDDAGIWWSEDGQAGLAHRRLAIIDLSPGGHQPMQDISGQFTIVFNGEIYNYLELKQNLEKKGHQFRTASDTEVILEAYRAWGVNCLSKLNGMFAFCLYDSRLRRLFLARDRAGEKPLFYQHTNKSLMFASELKALMSAPKFPRNLNIDALDHYLAYGYVPGEMCMIKDVYKILPGYALTYEIETDHLHTWQYWNLPEPLLQQNISVEELTNDFQSLLKDAVQRQMIADVPVGVLLSGGIDSSLITSMAAHISSHPVKTFTVSFPGHGKSDEGPFARLVADYFGTQHTELAAEPTTVELMPELARQYDEPIADHAIVPTYLLSKLIRRHVTVALSGDGGDELFGGYNHYSWIQRMSRLRRFIPKLLRQGLGFAAAHILPPGIQGRNHIIGFAGDTSYNIAHVNLYFDQWSRSRLLSPIMKEYNFQLKPETYKSRLCEDGHSPLHQAMEADFKSTLADGYLVKTDRAAMLASLELRAPFLDYRIIEFAFGRVPDFFKATETDRKILPRRLAQRLLPKSLDLKRKQGFTMPLADWFKGEWGSYMKSVLQHADPSLFNKNMIRSLIVAQEHGYANTNRLFALTMFELWRREYKVSLSN